MTAPTRVPRPPAPAAYDETTRTLLQAADKALAWSRYLRAHAAMAVHDLETGTAPNAERREALRRATCVIGIR